MLTSGERGVVSEQIYGPVNTGDTYHVYEIDKGPVEWPVFINVPSKQNFFVGHDELIQKLVDRLLSGENPALSAEGLPGVGKTAIAIELAHHSKVLAHFKHGVLWARLGPNSDVMSQLSRWANALHIDESEQDISQAIKDKISLRQLLLVIDDAWDTEEDSGKYLGKLRCGGPNCCYLLTTRNSDIARNFAGTSQVEMVPVLDDEPAYHLLQKFAKETCEAYPTETQELIKAVGKLPLAIVLLGGYLSQTVHRAFSELQEDALQKIKNPTQRLQLLQDRLGASKDTKLTLLEIINISLEELPESIRQTFYALGAFASKPHTFTKRAAEIVTKADAEMLARLLARNLLEVENESELTLHQVLSDVARTKTPINMWLSHKNFYLNEVARDKVNFQYIEQIYGQIKWAWIQHLKKTSTDVLKTFEFMEALFIFQQRRGLWRDQEAIYQACLDVLEHLEQDTDTKSVVMSLTMNLGFVYEKQNRLEAAHELFQKSLRISRELGDRKNEGSNLLNIGLIYKKWERWEEAIQLYELDYAICRELMDDYGAGITLVNMGEIYCNQGRVSEAYLVTDLALKISQELDDTQESKDLRGLALTGLGNVFQMLGQFDQAVNMLEQSLSIRRELSDRPGESVTLSLLGAAYLQQGQLDRASQMFRQSRNIKQALDDLPGESEQLINLGNVYFHQNKVNQAIDVFKKSLDIVAQKPEFSKYKLSALKGLGICYYQQGNLEKAIEVSTQILNIYRKLGDRSAESGALMLLGNIYLQQGHSEEAIELFELSLGISRELGDRFNEGYSTSSIGLCYLTKDDLNQAFKALEDSLDIFREIEDSHGESLSLFYLGYAYLRTTKMMWQMAFTKLHPDSHQYKWVSKGLSLLESFDDVISTNSDRY